MCETRGIEAACCPAIVAGRLTARAWLNNGGALLAWVALLSGCSLDSRTLTLDPSATAGSGPTGGSMPSSGGSSSTPMNVELPVCVYDESVPPDCATLVTNAGFAEDIAGWAPEDGINATWDPKNASNAGGSGSLTLLNLRHGVSGGFASGATVQCLPVTQGKYYDLSADVFIDEGQGLGLDDDDACALPPCSREGYEGLATLGVYFSDATDCSPPTTGNIFSPSVGETGRWLHLEATGRAPEQAQSMAVRLDTLKPFRQYFFTVLYDNVFVRER
jgi:hypothetical protein